MQRLRRWKKAVTGSRGRFGQDGSGESSSPEHFTSLPCELLPKRAAPPIKAPAPSPSRTEGPFFCKLPPEIRQHIYGYLFGERTVHIDYKCTAVRQRVPHLSSALLLDDQKRWIWLASTCHRSHMVPESWDNCNTGQGYTKCEAHETPCSAAAGISWLLTCRRAYHEGIPTLYRSWTFFITSGSPLLYSAPLLGSLATENIRSLVVTLEFHTLVKFAKDHLGLQPGLPAYRALILGIHTGFPNLHNLVLCLFREWRDWGRIVAFDYLPRGRDHVPELEEETLSDKILVPIDHMIRDFGSQMEECLVSIDGRFFDWMLAQIAREKQKAEADSSRPLPFSWSYDAPRSWGWKYCWRNVRVQNEEEQDGETESKRLGYWIRGTPTSTPSF
jgi:hypothetical protein